MKDKVHLNESGINFRFKKKSLVNYNGPISQLIVFPRFLQGRWTFVDSG